ncbi:hypothetical protein FOXB_15608 [Fusarium oxysporum f. sp. conglutinans Fo5176]|uniref:Uncharacterized protein n=1 Tax=Fusarium oxysporum (strain Fo5176) TaxID=660025 RepID=F9GAC6_FUSOF|nr:hypothetical protein FOXB_15608 [Fusarium oxysporum f. sp. conglutinans Fo5176]
MHDISVVIITRQPSSVNDVAWLRIVVQDSVLVKSLERYNDLVDNIRPNLFHLSQDRPAAITE